MYYNRLTYLENKNTNTRNLSTKIDGVNQNNNENKYISLNYIPRLSENIVKCLQQIYI